LSLFITKASSPYFQPQKPNELVLPALPKLQTPESLPGDCDVQAYIRKHITAYNGDASFLAPPTPRTLRAWDKCQELMALEQERGILDVDCVTPSTITSHPPGYLLGPKDDVIVGLQTDAPLKRACKPKGGFRVVNAALKSYGYEMDPVMKATYEHHVQTHNDLVFDMYTDEMRRARSSHLLTGLPDSYGRGRIIGDYRRIAMYGVKELIERKKRDFAAVPGSHEDTLRLRSEVARQIRALQDLLKMAATYGVDLSLPANSFQEAVQGMWLGHVAALKEQDGAAMSVGRWDGFLDIMAERDLAAGTATEQDIQEVIDDLVIKMRLVRHLRPPEYNALFAGDPTWTTLVLGGCDDACGHMVTKTTFRFLHSLSNLGSAPEPNLTVLWSQHLPQAFKEYCATQSIRSSSIQYENDDMMRTTFGSDYAIACCVSAMRLGVDMQFFGARANAVKLLLMCLNQGRDEVTGVCVSPAFEKACIVAGIGNESDGEPLDFAKIEDFYFEVALPWLAALYAETMNLIHYSHDRTNYESMQMALHNTKVNRFMAFGIAGLSVLVDSFSTLKHDKVCAIRNEMGLTTGFRRMNPGNEIPVFGNNDDAADALAQKVVVRFHQELSKLEIYRNATPTLSILTITSNVVYGKATGASPDGRAMGEPFAPGANPMHGRDKSGVLASLASVAKIPYSSCLDGISNTLTLIPAGLGFVEKKRSSNLVSLLDGYFGLNAHHVNINVLDRATLEDAHEHPEKYPNLTIRVSGYCVKFTKLSPEQRQEVLARTMHTSRIASFVKPRMKQQQHVADVVDPGDDAIFGSVHAIETFSTTDGPGIRMNIFLQGCAKRCTFCCNPETWEACNPLLANNAQYAMTTSAVVAQVKQYKEFLSPNHGGVTISGGEPLMQPKFVAAVFQKIHNDLGLTTCLDTACHGVEADWDHVLQHTDYVMLCLKAMDNRVAANIAKMTPRQMKSSKTFGRHVRDKHPHVRLSLRWVLLQGITDTDKELNMLMAYCQELFPVFTHVELIPYHDLGREKYDALFGGSNNNTNGSSYCLQDMPPYPLEKAIRVQERLEKEGGIRTILAKV
jgi:formate C-acetyltransferase